MKINKRDIKVRKQTPSHAKQQVHTDKTKYKRKGKNYGKSD